MKSSWLDYSKEMNHLFSIQFIEFLTYTSIWVQIASPVHEVIDVGILTPTLRAVRELFEDELVEVYNTEPWRTRIFVHERRGEGW